MKFISVLIAVSLPFAYAQSWEIDPAHASAQFSVRHMMISNVKGEFTKVTGKVVYDPKNLAGGLIGGYH